MHLKLHIQQKRGRDWNRSSINNNSFLKAGYTSGFYHPFFDITGFLTEVNPYLE